MATKRAVEFYYEVVIELIWSLDSTVAADIGFASVEGPGHRCDFPSHQIVVVLLTRAQCDIGLAFAEVEKPVTHNEVNPHPRVSTMKLIKQRGLHQPIANRLRAGNSHRAAYHHIGSTDKSFDRYDRSFHLRSNG